MATLIDCPTCKNRCSENADSCPKCGEKFNQQIIKKAKSKETNKGIFSFFMISAIVVTFYALTSSDEEPAGKSAPTPTSQPTAEQIAQQAKKAAEEADNKRRGFHCLSAWDGSHTAVKRYVEQQMRDPDSFDHIETLISPVKDGQHLLSMKYRARNGFGGMNIGQAMAKIDNATCEATIVSIE